MASFASQFADMLADQLTVQAVTLDARGDFTASGSSSAVDCRIEGERRLIRDPSGREVLSTVSAIIPGNNGLTVDGHRYTLPARFDPRTNLVALRVDVVTDEGEVVYEEVFFP